MRSSLALVLGAAAAVLASDVHELKKETFEAFVKENHLVLAEFFAPWCGHCKALAPEYEEAATALKEKNIALVKVDCTEESELCSGFGVEGYPTLKIFRGADNVSPYSGPRKAQSIISYMTKQSLPAVSVLDEASLEEFKTADKVVMVAYFAADDKVSNETFTAVADKFRDSYLFGATADAALAKAEGIEQPSIVLYKSFDEGKNTFTEKFEQEAIEKFATTAATPLVGEVGPETYQSYMSAGLPLAYIFAETAEEREELTKELREIAEKHKGVINFATIDATAFGQHGGNLNLEVGKWPAFAIQEIAKNQKFPYDQTKGITKENIGTFVEEFLAGKMQPSIKSEPIPEKQEGVHIIVAHNYEDVVINNEKDVLVEFYAPWCGHCKALAPKYDELAELYSKHDNVVVAKVDATANDIPDDIQGFPTIKLFPAGKKSEPLTFSGGRTVAELAAFVAESGTHKVAVDVPEEPKHDEDESVVSAAPAATAAASKGTEEEEDDEEKAKVAAEKMVEDIVNNNAAEDGGDAHDEL